jgi:hypothetical protein
MPSRSSERLTHRALPPDLEELRALFCPTDLQALIDKALMQLASWRREFERHLHAGAAIDAAHVLHRMTGTASFFGCDDRALSALRRLESELRSPACSPTCAILETARSTLDALADALMAERERPALAPVRKPDRDAKV